MSNAAITAETAITEHPECGGGTVLVLRLYRCPGCGHRVAVNGTPPRQTREQPHRAAAEILGRYLAKKAA
jgi:DNA-directed RNA polymerase subunit RPC12/RpoP